MDSIWLEAPAPAIRLWTDAQPLRWQLNRAALEWSLDVGLGESAWSELAPRIDALTRRAVAGRTRIGARLMRFTAVAMPEGRLVWLVADGVGASAGGGNWGLLAEKLELAQEFGRIGLFERDLKSGEGRWDKHMFRLFGIDPVLGTPPFEVAAARVHPEDRERVRQQHVEFSAAPGRYENWYRLAIPDGRVRYIHSLVEMQPGPDGVPAKMIGVLLDDTETSQRVRAQQALSDELARALNFAGIVVWRLDAHARRMEFNAVGRRFFGIAEDAPALTLQQLENAIHPDDLPRVRQAAREALRTRQTVDVLARYRRADGSWRHMLTRRAVEVDEQGRLLAQTGVAMDQTAQVAERERSRVLRRSVELVAHAAGVGLWSVDLPSGEVEWNAQMLQIYGLREGGDAPSIGEWFMRLIHPEDRRRVAARRRAAIAAGERSFELDFRIVRPTGEVRSVVCRCNSELRGGRPMIVGIHLDVTDRRAAEVQLAQQQERLATATRAAGMGVWERDADGDASFWDAQMYRLRGLEPDDPRSPAEITAAGGDPLLHASLLEKARRCMQRGEPYEHEFRCIWPDGSEHWIATVGNVRHDAHGRVTGMTGVNFDVTQRRRAEQALRERDAAERASRAKSEFLARMSHELRTPLNAVLGFAQLIEHDGARSLAPQHLERVSRIRTAGQHLLSLIEDMLDLSAVEAGKLPIAAEPVALDGVLDEVWQWVAPLAERSRVALHKGASDAWVTGDARRVRQVLANLLTNAIKYNRPGGNVWVEVEPLAERRNAVTVRDDGRGLSSEQRGHLFEPFNRLGAEHGAIEGVGLGLVVVRRLVEAMGGQIAVDSTPGRGTAMRVTLRAADAPLRAGGAGGRDPSAPDTSPQLRILYVEDNPVNVLLVEELVALRPNMALVSAADGEAGVRTARGELPDVVLVDVQLPDIDGYEVLRQLRRVPELQGAYVVAVSANAMPEEVARARAAGFDDYWTKPLDFARFLDALDAIARARGVTTV